MGAVVVNPMIYVLPDSLFGGPASSSRIESFSKIPEDLLTEEGFIELLEAVKDDVRFVKDLILKHFEYFRPFVRGGNIENILTIVSEISEDTSVLQSLNLKCCRYDKECKRKECCAYIHTLDFDQIIKPMRYLHENTAKFIEGKHFSNSSAMIRNLYFIHNAIWNSLSRRTFGKNVVLGMIKQIPR